MDGKSCVLEGKGERKPPVGAAVGKLKSKSCGMLSGVVELHRFGQGHQEGYSSV